MHNMTEARRKRFLDDTNKKRNILALGKLKRQIKKKYKNGTVQVTGYKNGVFTGKTAADMGEMVSTGTLLHLMNF